MNLNLFYIRIIRGVVQHYSPEKYWRRRSLVIDPNSKIPLWLKYYYLYYIKRADAFNNASFATNINKGARFKTPPILLHGLNGIIIGLETEVGANCTICHQVTIQSGGVKIGDNVFIGAGAKILSGVTIGDNVKIGANAVVVEDIPDHATVVLQEPRIIIKQ